jgi:hypothetical protein
MKRLASLLAAASIIGGGAAMALTSAAATASPGASAAANLPTMTVAVTGKTGVAVSGSTVSGAVSITSTFSGKGQGAYGLVRLHDGVTFQQAFQGVQSAHGDPNGLTPFGTLLVSAGAPGTVQTVLTPGNYVALNLTGSAPSANVAQFKVTPSSAPAALPAAAATETSIEFGFQGPNVLHDGTMVRVKNGGYLVHMDSLIGARSKADAEKIIVLLKAGKDNQAEKLATGFADLMDPASPGAMQQQVLNTKPGYYVQACFMSTQDGREHTMLGMERVIRVAK